MKFRDVSGSSGAKVMRRFSLIFFTALSLLVVQSPVSAETADQFVDKFYNLYIQVREEQDKHCANPRGALPAQCNADYNAFYRKFAETTGLQQLYTRATQAGNQFEIHKLWPIFQQSRTEMLAMKDDLDKKYYYTSSSAVPVPQATPVNR